MPILRAARDFLATLDSRQQRQVSFDIQSDAWRCVDLPDPMPDIVQIYRARKL
jgi:hypothetical protein